MTEVQPVQVPRDPQTNLPRAFAVNYSDVDRWDVTSFLRLQWEWAEEYLKPIGSVLIRKNIAVETTSGTAHIPIIDKISFGGTITVTKPADRADYKGRLFWAHSGDFVYSKIRVKQGSCAIVPPEIESLAVSAEYPVYTIDEAQIIPAYFVLVLKSRALLRHLDSVSHGGSTKTRIHADTFEMQTIPLPPLETQRAIVAAWQDAQDRITQAKREIVALHDEAENYLLQRIGLPVAAPTMPRGAFMLHLHEILRWDTQFYRTDFRLLEQQLQKQNALPLRQVLRFVGERGWKASDFPEGTFRYIEISSVKKQTGINGAKTVAVKDAPSRAAIRVKKGDLLLATTRPYLGAFATVPEEYDGCVCSSGFTVADATLSPDIEMQYVLLFLKSAAGLRQMERYMTGGSYPAIVQTELERVLVPIPSPNIQREIIAHAAETQNRIATLRRDAEILTQTIRTQTENAILGKTPLP